MAYWIYLVTVLLISQVTTVPIGSGQPSDSRRSLKEPFYTDEQQLRNLDPSINPKGDIKSVQTAQKSTLDHHTNNADAQEKQLKGDSDKQQGTEEHPKSSDENMKTKQNMMDFTEEELEDSFDSILKDVLITLRDHPEIVRDIMEEEELEEAKQPPAKSDFQRPSPQLFQEPKKVEKKAGWRQHVPKFSKGMMSDKDDDDSSEENYYKLKYGSTKHSDDPDHQSEEESEHSSEETREEEEEASHDSSHDSSEDKSSSSSQETQPIIAMKRRPEKFEPTIDLTSLPEEGGLDDPVNAGTKKRNNVDSLQKNGHHDQKSQAENELRKNFKSPFINPLPLFSPKQFQPLKDIGSHGESINGQLMPHISISKSHKDRVSHVKNIKQDKENENELAHLANLEGKQEQSEHVVG